MSIYVNVRLHNNGSCNAGFEEDFGVFPDCSGFPCSTQGMLQLGILTHKFSLFLLLPRLQACHHALPTLPCVICLLRLLLFAVHVHTLIDSIQT